MKTILSSRRDRHLAMFCIFLVVVALIGGIVGCGGGGEEEEEEEEEEQYIETWDDLDDIRNDLGGKYVLANNLDSTTGDHPGLASETANNGKGWEPIGTKNQPFTGSFNGTGCTITGLYINRPEEDYVGLFGYVEEADIKNVGLLEVDVTGRDETGALVGHNERGTVGNDLEKSYSTYSTGTVASYRSAGGLVGYNWDGIVSLCHSSAKVSHTSGECYRAGGLVGTNYGNMFWCSYSGDVAGVHEVGGMVGLNGGQVTSCQGEYTVIGKLFVGGEVGTNLGNLDSAFFQGLVNGKPWPPKSLMAVNEGTTGNSDFSDTAPDGSCVGLLVGRNYGTINKSIGIGSVNGTEGIGGVAGYNAYNGTVDGCIAVATIEGTANVGLLVGMSSGTVANCRTGSAADMMDIAIFQELGWDICEVDPCDTNPDCQWNIVAGQTYPFLSGKQLEGYDLIISSTEGGDVTSPGEGTFTYCERLLVNLVAEADEGYQFVNWSGDVGTVADINAASTTITIQGNCEVAANFEALLHSTYKLICDVPTFIPLGKWTMIPVTLKTDQLGELGYDDVQLHIKVYPRAGDVTIKLDPWSFTNEFYSLEYDLPADYNQTIYPLVYCTELGEYTFTFSLIEAPFGPVINNMTESIIVSAGLDF
jgi:hypothetical protein